MYPLLKTGFQLTFAQVGLITLTYQCTASLLQPMVGFTTDRHPQPYSLAAGMASTLIGIILFSRAPAFPLLLASSALIGMGSAVFHPEASRVAHLASGGQHGLAQSLFQVGGNAGGALGPLLAALFVLPRGRESIGWFGIAALLAILILSRYRGVVSTRPPEGRPAPSAPAHCRQGLHTEGRLLPNDPHGPDFFEVLLSRKPQQLLHFLFDQQVSRLDTERTDPPFRVPWSSGSRDPDRRTDWGPHWSETCHLGVGPGGPALYPPVAARLPRLDWPTHRGHRPDPGVRVSRNRGVCPRAHPGEGRDDFRPLLWLGIWHGWNRRGGIGKIGRRDEHHDRVSGMCLPPATRGAGWVSPRSATRTPEKKTGLTVRIS